MTGIDINRVDIEIYIHLGIGIVINPVRDLILIGNDNTPVFKLFLTGIDNTPGFKLFLTGIDNT